MNKTTLAVVGLVLLLLAAILITIGYFVKKDHLNAGWWIITVGLIFLMFAALFLLAAIIYHPGPIAVNITEKTK
jgi:protein-S-isoprenylcysteine O-methyltransferase Ste14